MDPRTSAYLNDRGAADPQMAVLRVFAEELSERMPVEQLRSLAYLAGRRLGTQYGVGPARTVADFEVFANRLFLDLDWGWVSLMETQDGVDFRHGCAPLVRWFGKSGLVWGGGLFEGLYAEWMRQLGAGPQLDVKEVAAGPQSGEVLHFRLAHETSFA